MNDEVKNNSGSKDPLVQLLEEAPRVVNIGVPGFAQELNAQGVSVVQVDWRPPAGGDPELARILSIVGS